jgi:hypothetical protein
MPANNYPRRIADLQEALARERALTDRLAEALEAISGTRLSSSWHEISAAHDKVEAALAAVREARRDED